MGFCVAKFHLIFRGESALAIWKHALEASLQDFPAYLSQQLVAVRSGSSPADAEKSYACVIFDRTSLSFNEGFGWLEYCRAYRKVSIIGQRIC